MESWRGTPLAASLAAMGEAAAPPDREARMRAFEELFHTDVPFPLEGDSAGLAGLTEQQLDESAPSQSAPEVPVVESRDEPELSVPSAATQTGVATQTGAVTDEAAELNLTAAAAPAAPAAIEAGEAAGFAYTAEAITGETISASELQLDAASLADWLSTGKIPDAPHSRPAAAPEAEMTAEPAVENEDAPHSRLAAAMVCDLAKEHPAGGSVRTYLPPEANEVPAEADGAALVETYSGVEPAQSESEAPRHPEPLSSAAEEVAPAELACTALERQADVLQDGVFETEATAEQPAEELASAEPCAEPEVWESYSPEPETGEPYLPEPGASETDLAESESAAAGPRNEAARIQEAVQNVFERFRPLLVAAIARELARLD